MGINMNFSIPELRKLQQETQKPDVHPDTALVSAIEAKDVNAFRRAQRTLAVGLEATARAVAPR